jgi:outer membrane protein
MFKKTGAATAGSISRLVHRERVRFFVMALGGLLLGMTEPQTLLSALAQAYAGNPDLNHSRAAVRVRDEDMPKALAGMRPRVNIQASAGPLYGNLRLPFGRNAMTGQRQVLQEEYTGYPRGATLNMSQSIFDAGRTTNSVRQAESNVFAARAAMRLTEQATLQNGATAYMNVLHDAAVVNLRKNNIAVLEQQLKQTRDRFQVGEVTRTDVAQAEASVAQARSVLYAALAQLNNSIANYRQIIGVEPKHLEPGRSLETLSATLTPASDRDCARRTSGRHRGAASGGCYGVRGEGRRERAGTHCVSERPGFPAMGFFPGRSRIAPILRRGLRSAQCAAVSGRLGICLDPPGKRAIEPSAAQR